MVKNKGFAFCFVLILLFDVTYIIETDTHPRVGMQEGGQKHFSIFLFCILRRGKRRDHSVLSSHIAPRDRGESFDDVLEPLMWRQVFQEYHIRGLDTSETSSA